MLFSALIALAVVCPNSLNFVLCLLRKLLNKFRNTAWRSLNVDVFIRNNEKTLLFQTIMKESIDNSTRITLLVHGPSGLKGSPSREGYAIVNSGRARIQRLRIILEIEICSRHCISPKLIFFGDATAIQWMYEEKGK